ncbi:MAG: hypothetical protein QXF12_01425 [Candidatus Aenigmatarchaeota archaeon]
MKDVELKVKKSKIIRIENLGKQKKTVYDIGVNDECKYFFANNILVHNSVYFSLDTALKRNKHLNEKYKNFEINKDNIVNYYDEIAKKVNDSFKEFLKEKFNVNKEYAVIRAGRELVGSSGLFVAKKRYAVLVYDKEGVRLDKDKSGIIKAMGLDLKRSDTPEIVQKFLQDEILMSVLEGKTKEFIFEKIKEFKKYFRSLEPWKKGIPKRVNGLTEYTEKYERMKNEFSDDDFYHKRKAKNRKDKNDIFAIPGHVMASINYNKLRNLYKDNVSLEIQDGSKIIVCYLKPNNKFNMHSVAYPIDQINLPDWFKNLPFDEDEMERIVLDKKIQNLLEVMNWEELENLNNYNNLYDDFFMF